MFFPKQQTSGTQGSLTHFLGATHWYRATGPPQQSRVSLHTPGTGEF